MEVLILLVLASVALASGFVGFFVWSAREGTHQHADRLALLPLAEDDPSPAPRARRARPELELELELERSRDAHDAEL